MNTPTTHSHSVSLLGDQGVFVAFKKLVPERQESVLREIRRERKAGSRFEGYTESTSANHTN